MSRYLQTLKRLQETKAAEAAENLVPIETPDYSGPSIDEPELIERRAAFPELNFARRDKAAGHLLEVLRGRVTEESSPRVVIAGVSHVESLESIVAGLIKQGRRRGLTIGVVDLHLEQGTRILRERSLPDSGDEGPGPSQVQPRPVPRPPSILDLSKDSDPVHVDAWLEEIGKHSDLLVIKAPAVLSSADTVLLAKASGGLALVIEQMATERSALQEAVRRLQSTGCPILGLVVSGHRQWLPRWLNRLLAGDNRG